MADPDTGRRQELVVGSMFHVDAGTAYRAEPAAAGSASWARSERVFVGLPHQAVTGLDQGGGAG